MNEIATIARINTLRSIIKGAYGTCTWIEAHADAQCASHREDPHGVVARIVEARGLSVEHATALVRLCGPFLPKQWKAV